MIIVYEDDMFIAAIPYAEISKASLIIKRHKPKGISSLFKRDSYTCIKSRHTSFFLKESKEFILDVLNTYYRDDEDYLACLKDIIEN